VTVTTLVGEPRRHLALRARVSVTFALISLLLTALLAATTYFLARTYMLDQRERTATRQMFLNARLVKGELARDGFADVGQAIEQLQGELNSTTLIYRDDRWYLSSARVTPESIPADLVERVRSGGAGRRRLAVSGDPYIVVGTPITDSDTEYYEFVPLENLERTLRILAGSLAVASGITAIAGAAVGFYASRRLLRPLERVSAAAVDIAGGRLDTRLDDEGDRDLEPLVRSFNEMAGSLQQRIESEARFASDVSHELRTPLTALSTAVQVVRARQADLPPRTRLAVDVLETQIRYFERLVLDLLEISRIDAGAAELTVESVDVVELARAVTARYGVAVEVAPGMDPSVAIDRRRIERVLVNLLDNAEHHAGGATVVRLSRTLLWLAIEVEDNGPGIPPAERQRIFDRFWRGPGARQQAVKGTGLGLALVAEHVRAHGGQIRVEDNPRGGARFVVEIPVGVAP
jgi:two-component system, OmpR family, sensor histidine kinase MtrB